MPDITMCADAECPRAEKCYRFTARPSGVWQACFSPCEGWECEYFIKVEEEPCQTAKPAS